MSAVLSQMVKRLHHRGPDGQGTWWDGALGIGLCHTRLAILDLSDKGAQPMHSSDGLLSVVYNGEIYNWQELRGRLESRGVQFQTRTDTEVLLESYRAYGIDVLHHLRGMFAFALFDHRSRTLFCARDRVGKKPFVYAETRHGFAFASELPAALTMPGCDTTLNHPAIASMLLRNLRHIPDPYTAYRGLKRLRPGHAMVVRDGRIVQIWRYWTPSPASQGGTPGRLRELLEEAVRLRLIADVPVGALLSGGTDSSAVVNLMGKFSQEPVRTYALGLNRADEDLRRARVAAKQLGSIHKEFYFDPEHQLTVFRDMLAIYGEPIMLLPLIHTYELCQAVRDDGVKVVLSGNGADELFYGYTGHLRQALISACLAWLTSFISRARQLPPLRTSSLGFLMAKPGVRKATLYLSAERETWDDVLVPEVKYALTNLAAEECEYWGKLLPEGPYIDEASFVALMVENTHSVTIASDLPAMMSSIEMRAPFLDQEMVALALATHYREKVPHFLNSRRLKQILKTAVADLVPHELLYASKRGFGYDIQEGMVLQGPWRKIADQLFAEPNDADGLFTRDGIRALWAADTRGNRVPFDRIAKHFAIQMWLRDHQRFG